MHIHTGAVLGILENVQDTYSVLIFVNSCQKQPPEVSMKKGVLENFAKFAGKHLCQSLFFNKVAGLSLQLYWKRDSVTGVFLWILQNCHEHLFYRTALDGCFWVASTTLPKMKFFVKDFFTNLNKSAVSSGFLHIY